MIRTAIRALPFCLLVVATPAVAQEEHESEPGHQGLHSSHPLVTESVSPDTKFRVTGERVRPDIESEPFLNGGLMRGDLEVVGWLRAGFETSAESGEGTPVHWDLSALYHLTPRVMALVEYNAATVAGGDAAAEAWHAVTPGLKVQPLANPALKVGIGWSVAVAGEPGFESRLLVSAFWHL